MVTQHYFSHFRSRYFQVSLAYSVALFLVSLYINFYAGTYATTAASNYVTDIILDNIPVYDVDGIFVYGALALCAFIFLVCAIHPHRFLFVLKTISVFVIVRSVFVSLTHIAPAPGQVEIVSNLLGRFTFGADMFFSGHTGLPFLMALIFWQNLSLRYIFLATSIFFGTVVLLGHLHYSIDVFAAFFITYGIYVAATNLFKKDYILFQKTSGWTKEK